MQVLPRAVQPDLINPHKLGTTNSHFIEGETEALSSSALDCSHTMKGDGRV